ncbi:pilus assembly protein [Sanguibacter antarcticus]|uniref:Flp pilus assembly protein TadG n=1 Tax=Sanguibacter antarcticus TaxID=372484 RepID=A0A2A9E3S2_9MICO|nr:pilus assembly protein [Sanguibacter antarcticus]PFG33687.1 hypothetical protein ATL42_1574 [Sanguibacter antarcticus]
MTAIREVLRRSAASIRSHLTAATGTTGEEQDSGSALVEFLGAAVILLIPTLYLVVTLGRVQAATFASEGAAKEAGRAFSLAGSVADGSRRAEAAVGLALADQGFSSISPAGALTVSCSTVVCLEPGSDVTTTVRVDVTLPGLGGGADSWLPLSIPVSARIVTPVDEYKEAGE